MDLLNHIFIILVYIKLHNMQTNDSTETFCRNRTRLVSSDKADQFELVQAILDEEVILQCNFCDNIDDEHPKNWYKVNVFNNILEEVNLGIENNMSLNRIHINNDHSLTILNITQNDVGEYLCRGLNGDEASYQYNFLLDVVSSNNDTDERGNLTAWKNYHDQQFSPINHLMETSTAPDYVFLRTINVHLEVVTEWDAPGACEVCGRAKGDGRRYTKGRCRFKITTNSTNAVSFEEKLVVNAVHLSCRSLALAQLIPGIINVTKTIPDFIQYEKCTGICNPDAEGVYKGWQSTKKTGFKYKKTFVLAENAHLTLICPESTLDNQVVWNYNGKVIKRAVNTKGLEFFEPRVTVDSFNTLYLYGVTKDEEGNYTCYVDEVRMQQVRVFVVSKAKLITQAFVRHMMYLGFVLSLTLTCYCSGLVITWTRRKKFKSYKEVRKELREAKKLLEESDSDSDKIEEIVTSTEENDTNTTNKDENDTITPKKDENDTKTTKKDENDTNTTKKDENAIDTTKNDENLPNVQ